MTAATAPGAARGRAHEGASRREDLRHALVDGVTAPLNQVRTDKGKLRVAIASQLRRSILVFRNLEEAANLFQGHHQQQFHPAPLCTHRQRMLYDFWWLIELPPSAGGVPRLFFYPFHQESPLAKELSIFVDESGPRRQGSLLSSHARLPRPGRQHRLSGHGL